MYKYLEKESEAKKKKKEEEEIAFIISFQK